MTPIFRLPIIVASFLCLLLAVACTPAPSVSAREAHRMASRPADSVVVMDARAAREFGAEHLPGAINVDPMTWASCNHNPNISVIVYCNTGRRSIEVTKLLEQAGYRNAVSIEGGLQAWKAAGYPTQR